MKRFKIKCISFLILILFVFILSGCASNASDNAKSVASKKQQTSGNTQQGVKSDENSKTVKESNKTEEVNAKTTLDAEGKTNLAVNGNLKVHFINVGQADSILIEQGSKFMLIDAGNNGDGKLVKNYLLQQGVKSLDYVIGTHPHEDHIGGLDYIINDFEIDKIYLPKATSTTKAFGDVVTAIKNKGMKVTVPKPGETFNLGSAKCTILAPNNSKYKDLNNYSIVVKLEFGSNSFLLTGDAEDVSEREILAKGFNVKADLLKVGHHGSRSSTTDEYLAKVNPKYAVISSETGNDYGHPHKETMDKLKKKNILVYRTDELGTIVATSNGKTISFNTKPGSYNAGTH
ncbi:MBL fold metallo-hydrolase [Clostridium estertheticum]|uniref:ComEC/Rec2 family competence protein n=1 Tax=Clostridium estertheticum TaxID=238834 RepID=UPI0013E94A8D|nr:ComEC/Rec2 family competence protein [Clostridium estertheticum]MBZ9689189.1 MBL fold metallo-hydrolase [Clostridium estertheticum]